MRCANCGQLVSYLVSSGASFVCPLCTQDPSHTPVPQRKHNSVVSIIEARLEHKARRAGLDAIGAHTMQAKFRSFQLDHFGGGVLSVSHEPGSFVEVSINGSAGGARTDPEVLRPGREVGVFLSKLAEIMNHDPLTEWLAETVNWIEWREASNTRNEISRSSLVKHGH